MASVLSGLGGVEPFKVGTDASSVGQRCDRWKASFDLFVCASGVSDDGQKRSLLLHCAGGEPTKVKCNCIYLIVITFGPM